MRVIIPKGGPLKLLAVLFAVMFAALALGLPMTVRGQGGQIGVSNDGPSFISIVIEEDTDLIFVHILLRDLNGWDDIYVVHVNVSDDGGNPISQVTFRLYRDRNETTPAIEWEEPHGQLLRRDVSTWSPVAVEPWTSEEMRTEIGLELRFAYDTFSGHQIQVLALDKGLLSCEYDGPFSAEFTPLPMVRNYQIPLGLSILLAATGAALMTWNRYKNNKLARAVEAVEAAAAED